MKGQMASSRQFRRQKSWVCFRSKESLCKSCVIPECLSYPTSNYGVNNMLRNKQKKLISAERYIVGFNVIIFKKNYGCFKMASFKNV